MGEQLNLLVLDRIPVVLGARAFRHCFLIFGPNPFGFVPASRQALDERLLCRLVRSPDPT